MSSNIKKMAVMLTLVLFLNSLTACGKEETITEPKDSQTVISESQAEQADILHFVDAHGQWYDVEINDSWEKNSYDMEAFSRAGDKLSYEDDNYTYSLGIDVSKYQDKVDWERVKAAGYDFAFVRIGYRGYGQSGKLCEDEKAISHIKGAVSAGLKVGVYFFSQAINETEAQEEADFAVNILEKNGLGPEDITLPIVFDPESILNDEARTDNVTGEQFTKNTRAFCDTVREKGYGSMIYCNMLWEATMLDMGELSDIPVWYADYEQKPQTPYRFDYWQYSESASVDGIDSKIDVNICLIPKNTN